ncbi:MAG: flagellar FlbD family protein [Ruminococcus sp.]|nr:flagellar protein FlbD [Ruminococcus sp.]MBQ7008207.1 flagellar FlbD family protein [Ruminococcus sp.]
MIVLTRQNGSSFALNDELIEIIEEHPDTTLKMTDGKVYIVSESMEEIIEKIIEFRKRYTN